MKTHLHLLSMPMYEPLHPSSQLGYLHGHVQRTFGDALPVRSYSAHTNILFDLTGAGMTQFFTTHRLFGEEIFFLVCCLDTPERFERAYQLYQRYTLPEVHLSRDELAALARATMSYLDNHLLPNLSPDGLNVVGLTTTFAQLFASIFAANYIRTRTDAQLLFVFGGASMSLPEANRALDHWRVPGLLVTGSGEAPLEDILRGALSLPDGRADAAVDAIAAACPVNVHRIGSAPEPIDLSMPRTYMDGLGDPDYAEFFASLRALCTSEAVYHRVLEMVAVPLEGSRGCFARCDFCQNPNITTRFRSLTGQQVAARAQRLARVYGARHLYFADSVCNSWAEDYADEILASDEPLAAFMEMRVHAPESFFTKLALAGVDEMQLGIEAISEPLLHAMRKGTTVMQNLRATKYLAELQVTSPSNLISHHPKSTVADVAETRRIVELTEHFPPFCLSRFVISYASPIYNELTDDQRSRLTRGFTWLPEDLVPFSMVRDLAYPYPDEWVDLEVARAWDAFRRWYADFRAAATAHQPVFTAERQAGDRSLITDTRLGRSQRYVLDGDLARVFDLCHAGGDPVQLATHSGLAPESVTAILSELVERAMVVRIGDRYLSLALRPRDELIQNLAESRRPRRRAARALSILSAGV